MVGDNQHVGFIDAPEVPVSWPSLSCIILLNEIRDKSSCARLLALNKASFAAVADRNMMQGFPPFLGLPQGSI
jgi:hypothetical protein